MTFFDLFSFATGWGTLFLDLGLCAVLLAFFFFRPAYRSLMGWLSEVYLPLAFAFLGGSIGLGLAASTILGLEPCALCYLGRAFAFPLVPMVFLAMRRKEHVIAPYGEMLSFLGAGVSLYHMALQLGLHYGLWILPCPSTGVSCERIDLLAFGYITLPTAALTIFLVTWVLFRSARYRKG